MELWIWILLGLVAVSVLLSPILVAVLVYRSMLVRTRPDKWGRVCSDPNHPDNAAMWAEGIAWGEANSGVMEEVSIENDGLKLYGELFRFNDGGRCVIIIPGRSESLKYSYYYAPPYQQAGVNVLVIDTRAHGKSEGKYNTAGDKESEDAKAWVRYLEEHQGMDEIYFHTICVGTAAGMGAMTQPDRSPAVKGLIAEGCFTTFRETFRTHMKELKKPVFPVLQICMLLLRICAGADIDRVAPIDMVKRLDQRVLFLYGRQDVFSLPEKSQRLFDTCISEDKTLVWFDEGTHSHLRLADREKYDGAIIDFLQK